MAFVSIAAGVGAAASVGGSIASGQAQSSAASANRTANNNMYANNQALYGLAGTASNANIEPYQETGHLANTTLSGLLGLTSPQSLQAPNIAQFQTPVYTPGKGYTMVTNQVAFDAANREYQAQLAQAQAIQKNGGYGSLTAPYTAQDYQNSPLYTPMVNSLEDLQATPGYQFQLQQGLQSVNNSAAAKGSLLSGNSLEAINNYAQGQAATGFQNAWQRAQSAYQNAFSDSLTQKQNTYNMLSGQSGQGLSAANSANNVNMGVANGISNAGQNNLTGTTSANNQAANAVTNTAAGVNSGIQSGISNYLTGNYLTNKTETPTAPIGGNTKMG